LFAVDSLLATKFLSYLRTFCYQVLFLCSVIITRRSLHKVLRRRLIFFSVPFACDLLAAIELFVVFSRNS
jgi:hypothetical protein